MIDFLPSATADRLVPHHIAEAFERSQIGLPGLAISALVGIAMLTGMAAGIAAPTASRAPIDLGPSEMEECALAELYCLPGQPRPQPLVERLSDARGPVAKAGPRS